MSTGDWADDLCEAIRILRRYSDAQPFAANHRTLHVVIDAEEVSAEDLARLNALGFYRDGYGTIEAPRYSQPEWAGRR